MSPSPHQQLRSPQSAIRISSLVSRRASLILFYSLALVWLPIRLIQEANPEWRLVSWALALDVVGLTLLVIPISEIRSQRTELTSGLCHLSSAFTFPLFFFLVAVPWPTLIEGPLIQALTRANAAVTIELLNLLGIPAIQHGNLIEVGSGMVGIDEACSGIRSFQATLMISLFFGDLYRLSVLRRLSLCLSGFALSFVFNVGRTSLLTYVASRDGVEAIAKWHDPAGVTILVLCFISLWLLSLSLRLNPALNPPSDRDAFHCVPDSSGEAGEATHVVPSHPSPSNLETFPPVSSTASSALRPPRLRVSASPSLRPLSSAIPQSTFRIPKSAFGVLIWLLFSGIAVEGWYRGHERQIPGAAKWTVAWPTNTPSYQPIPFSEKTRQFLRHDEGANASWNETDGTRWQMIFLRWNPGKIAVHLAKSHTPQACRRPGAR